MDTLLKEFLFKNESSVEERKRRFTTAWDVSRIIEAIAIKQGREVLELLDIRLGEAFEGYRRRDQIDPERGVETSVFYKPAWDWEEDGGILSYSFRKKLHGFDLVGIRKYSDALGIPFSGEEPLDIHLRGKRHVLTNLFASVERWQACWRKDLIFGKLGMAFKVCPLSPITRDFNYILGIYLPEIDDLDFHLMMLEKGVKATVDVYVEYLRGFRKSTEPYIDAFVEAYRKAVRGN